MKDLTRWALMALASAALVFSGCDGDDDETTDDTTETDTASDDTGEADTGGEDTTAAGAGCSEADQTIVATADPSPTAVAGSCGVGCISVLNPADLTPFTTCTAECMADDAGVGSLSSTCIDCYAGSATCTAANCVADCAVDPSSDDCATCQVASGCIDSFYACSGLPQE